MQATGQFEPHHAAAVSEWDAKNKLSEADQQNPAKQAERTTGIEKLYREKIRGYESQFVRSFGGAPGQPQSDFFATPEQALYFENGGTLRAWAGALAGRVAALPDPAAMSEEVYLSILTRMPTAGETAEIAGTLANVAPDKKQQALSDYVWAFLTSVEFRFSH